MALTQVDQGLLGQYAQYTGFKNRIINGAMGIWQRGTSSSTSFAYLADRFYSSASSGYSASQSADVPSQVFPYSYSVTGTGYPTLSQRIESVNIADVYNQSVTVSFWLKQTSGAGAGSIGVNLYYPTALNNFGSLVQIGSTASITATSSWAYYTATFNSMPTQVANGLQLGIFANTAGAATFLITGVQLEKGSTATSFDYRPYGTELALCQRYYARMGAGTGAYTAFGIGRFTGGTAIDVYFKYPMQMRSAPTYNASNVVITGGTGTAVSATYAGTDTMLVNIASSGGTAGYAGVLLANGTTAGYVDFSAEL